MSRAKVNFDLPTGIENLDITVRFSSKVYPVVAIEAYGVTGEVESVLFWEALQDAYAPAGVVTSIKLREISRFIVQAPEAYSSAGEALEVELKTILKSVTQAPEAYASTGESTSVLLESKLVFHEQPPEAYMPTGAVISLELT